MTRLKRCVTRVVLFILLILVLNLAVGPAIAIDDEYSWDDKAPICTQTSQIALRACNSAERESYLLSIGTCHNLLNENEKADCLTISKRNLDYQINLCNEKFKARNAVCSELGEGAYNPQIIYHDFVKQFKSVLGNQYFPLKPGTLLTYRKVSPDGNESILRDYFYVTNQEKKILGVTCRGVWTSTKTKEGELKCSTLHWYAQDQESNVWSFGEVAQEFDQGLPIGAGGSWNAGVNGAMPGITMYADLNTHIGKTFRQQFFLGKVENAARIIGTVDKLPLLKKNTKLPKAVHGPYLHVQEFSPLSPESLTIPINKFYAPGVGLVLTVAPDGTHDALLSIGERLAVRY
jgi:hypothetical protein